LLKIIQPVSLKRYRLEFLYKGKSPYLFTLEKDALQQ